MVNDCVMLEGSGVCGDEEGENRNGIELSLELSIGGGYAKSKKLMASGVKGDVDSEEICRSSGGSGEYGACVDPMANKDIQALRRQEARKKRVNWKEMNGYGSSGNSSGGVGGVSIDNVDGIMEPASKRGKNVDGIVGEYQGSIPAQFTNGFVNLYGRVTSLGGIGGNEVKNGKCGFLSAGGRSFRPYQGNRNLERRCGKEGWPANASMSPGGSSSAFSDYQNSNLGGNTSDNGSNSSYTQAEMQQQKNVPAPSNTPEQSDHSGSSKQTESNQAAHSANMPKSNEDSKSDTDQSSSLINNPIPTTSNTNQVPLKEMSEADTKRHLPEPKMPCVTTTGNGPNGKTIRGFLYRYNKKEVSILCVCHRSSFSPSEFVEHAGGVNITHPLRHITVIPSAFG